MKKILLIALMIVTLTLYGCGSREETAQKVAKTTGSMTETKDSNDETTQFVDTEQSQTTTKETVVEESDSTTDVISSEQTTTEQIATESITTQAPTTETPTTETTTTTPAPTTTQTTTTQATTTQEITTIQAKTESTTTSVQVETSGAFKSFSVNTLDGQTLTQEVFGKADVNVVIIWTTWCGYCKLEMPALQKVMEKYSGQSVQFFSIVGDVGTYATEEDVQYWIDQMQVTYPCMLYNDSLSDGYMESISGYPTTLYLNRNGEIMMEFPGAYAANGEDYAIDAHSYYLDYCLANPDYLPEE